MTEEGHFSNDELVLCFHGPLLYEAKVIDVKPQSDRPFLVHYKGWKTKWDEWVPGTRLLKYDKNSISKAEQLRGEYCASPNPKRRESTQDTHTVDESAHKDESYMSLNKMVGRKRPFRIFLRRRCQRLLALDWDLVTKSLSLNALPPGDCTVSSLIDGFQQTESCSRLFSVKLKELFNASLGKSLLYRLERLQYLRHRMIHQDPISDHYSAMFLLRLLSRDLHLQYCIMTFEIGKLPSMIAEEQLGTPEDCAPLGELVSLLRKFSTYLEERAAALFRKERFIIEDDYLRVSKSS